MPELIQGPVGSNDLPVNGRYIDGEGRLYWNKERMDFPFITFLGMNGRVYGGNPYGVEGPIGEMYGGEVNVSGQALSKRKVLNAEYQIFEDEVLEDTTTVNLVAGYSASATSIVVTDASIFSKNDQVLVPRTSEVFVVTASDLTTNTLTVVRGVGSTAAALVNADYLVRLASAYAVNALSGTAKMTVPTRNYNYTQIFRTPVQIGRTDKDSKVNYSPTSDLDRLKRQAGIEHLRSQERAFLFGGREERAAVDGSGTRQRFTGGVFSLLTSNVMDLSGSGGVMTQGSVDAFAELVFARGSTEKIAFCSPRVLSRINGLYDNLIRYEPETKMFGSNVMELVTSHGVLKLVRHPMFGKGGIAQKHAGTMLVIDPASVKYAHLDQAENMYHDNIQENDRDGYKGEWLGECGLHLANETAHGVMLNVL